MLALTPDSRADDIDTLQVEPGERLALLIGAEGSGLSPEALEAAT